MNRCEECGHVYVDSDPPLLVEKLASLGPGYGERLREAVGTGGDAVWRQRPEPQVWSALEYACHVRDVFLAQRERLFLALVEDCPSFAPMYREQRVVLAGYAAQDPHRVAEQIDMAAVLVADAFEHVDEPGWRRECIYSFPAPARRSVAWLASSRGVLGRRRRRRYAPAVARCMTSAKRPTEWRRSSMVGDWCTTISSSALA